MTLALNRKSLTSRLAEIESNISSLQDFKKMSFKEFAKSHYSAAAELYLERSLEAVFDIGNHILSRLPLRPAERPEEYKAIAKTLGKHKIVPEVFADEVLTKMAGYRNRLVHHYLEITERELYDIIQHDLSDLEKFCSYIKLLIKDPKKHGFEIQ